MIESKEMRKLLLQLNDRFQDKTVMGTLKGSSTGKKTSAPMFVMEQWIETDTLVASSGGSFQRLFMISYLDEEILIIRNVNGIPEVLTRLDLVPAPIEDPIAEYESERHWQLFVSGRDFIYTMDFNSYNCKEPSLSKFESFCQRQKSTECPRAAI